MAKTQLAEKARMLRTKGASLNEIIKKLNIPKSTASNWCQDIALSKEQKRRLAKKQHMGGIITAEKRTKDRLALTKQIMEESAAQVDILSQRDLLMLGSALYWAEGYKDKNQEFGFTNSDPAMIKLMIKWLQEVCDIKQEIIHTRICINHIHSRRIKEIQNFWITITGLSHHQFSNPTFIKVTNKKVYNNTSNYFGTLRIKVRKSTNLQRKILGWIQGIKEQE